MQSADETTDWLVMAFRQSLTDAIQYGTLPDEIASAESACLRFAANFWQAYLRTSPLSQSQARVDCRPAIVELWREHDERRILPTNFHRARAIIDFHNAGISVRESCAKIAAREGVEIETIQRSYKLARKAEPPLFLFDLDPQSLTVTARRGFDDMPTKPGRPATREAQD